MTKKERRAEEHRKQRRANAHAQNQPVITPSDSIQPAAPKTVNSDGQSDRSEDKKKSFKQVFSECNFWVACFTGALVFTSIIQWTAMRAQLDLSKRTSEKQLRAYVGITNIALKQSDTNDPSDASGIVVMPLKNFGATPARDVHVVSSFLAVEIPRGRRFGAIPEDFSFPDTFATDHDDRPRGAHSYVVPGQEIGSSVAVDRKFPIFDGSFMTKFTFYTYGHIDYIDVFGNWHSQLFCFQWAPEAAIDANTVYEFMRTKEHNGEDQDSR